MNIELSSEPLIKLVELSRMSPIEFLNWVISAHKKHYVVPCVSTDSRFIIDRDCIRPKSFSLYVKYVEDEKPFAIVNGTEIPDAACLWPILLGNNTLLHQATLQFKKIFNIKKEWWPGKLRRKFRKRAQS